MTDFDLTAAGVRADAADLDATLDLLARKLEIALPEHTTVRRARRRLRSLVVVLGPHTFTLRRDKALSLERVTRIHDMRSERTVLELPEWLAALEAALAEEADRSAQARAAVDRLLD